MTLPFFMDANENVGGGRCSGLGLFWNIELANVRETPGFLIGVLKERTESLRRGRCRPKSALVSERLSSVSESKVLLNELSAGTLGARLCSGRGGEEEGK